MSFINIVLSFGISACRYAPVRSKLDRLHTSCASIISVNNNASKYTVGDKSLSTSLRYLFCLLTSAQVLPFILPHLFYFVRFPSSKALIFSSMDIFPGLIGVTTGFHGMGPLSIFLNSFIIAATDILKNI